MKFCNKSIPTRSQYADAAEHKCHCLEVTVGNVMNFHSLNI